MKAPKLAYLVSQYPAISHTFILREIRRLRVLGAEIETASINTPDRSTASLDIDETEEMENTFYIKKQGFINAAFALAKMMFISPVRLLQGIWLALSLGGYGIKRLFKHFAYLGEAALLGQWMQSLGISHVHVHFANPASTVALLSSYLFPISFSLTVHGPDEFYDVTLNHLPLKVQKAQFIVCVSDYAQSQLMRISPISEWYKFNVIRLGVDPEVFVPTFEPVHNRPCQILCVGRLVPSKGQHILMIAFDKLIQKGKKAHLRLVGGGPDYNDLEKEARRRNLQNHVYFSGPLNPHQVVDAYKYADVVALASFAEGVPVVLMEAMAMEIPCVASAINGIPELIRHNAEGLLVPPSNIEQLTQALELLVDDAELRRRLGRAGRSRIQEKFNLEENVESLFYFFSSVANVSAETTEKG